MIQYASIYLQRSKLYNLIFCVLVLINFVLPTFAYEDTIPSELQEKFVDPVQVGAQQSLGFSEGLSRKLTRTFEKSPPTYWPGSKTETYIVDKIHILLLKDIPGSKKRHYIVVLPLVMPDEDLNYYVFQADMICSDPQFYVNSVHPSSMQTFTKKEKSGGSGAVTVPLANIPINVGVAGALDHTLEQKYSLPMLTGSPVNKKDGHQAIWEFKKQGAQPIPRNTTYVYAIVESSKCSKAKLTLVCLSYRKNLKPNRSSNQIEQLSREDLRDAFVQIQKLDGILLEEVAETVQEFKQAHPQCSRDLSLIMEGN